MFLLDETISLENSAKTAQQWSKYVKREQGHQAQMAMLILGG